MCICSMYTANWMSAKIVCWAPEIANMPMYKQWVLSKDAPILNSKPKTSQKLCEKDFELVEEQLRELCKGEILCRALFLSIDPITRLYISYGLGKSISKFFGIGW